MVTAYKRGFETHLAGTAHPGLGQEEWPKPQSTKRGHGCSGSILIKPCGPGFTLGPSLESHTITV